MSLDELTLLAYVDGELPEQRRREVEAAIAADEELARVVRSLQASLLPYQSAFGQQALPPVPDALRSRVEELSAVALASYDLAIEAHEPEERIAVERDLRQQRNGLNEGAQRKRTTNAFRRLLVRVQPWLGGIVIGQFSLLILLAGLLVFGERPEAPQFHLLGTTKAAQPDVVTVFVLFDGRVTEGSLQETLNAAGARIVNGPTETGAYVLRLPAARAAIAIEAMRQKPGVMLVEQMNDSAMTR